jgi:hypothetical protein
VSDYRDTAFAAYASRHAVLRKGSLTPAKLESRARQWEVQLAEFLPSSTDHVACSAVATLLHVLLVGWSGRNLGGLLRCQLLALRTA